VSPGEIAKRLRRLQSCQPRPDDLRWEAYEGTSCIEIGKKRDGKPRRMLVSRVLVVHAITDMRAIRKAHPHLTFFQCWTDRRGLVHRKVVES
jgi:hypothetical protein